MALEENGSELTKGVLRFIRNRFMKFFESSANDIQTALNERSKRGEMSVNKLLKQNFDKINTPNMKEELMKSLSRELKKYNLAYAIQPQGLNEEINEMEYKILYNSKDAPVILNAIDKVKKDMLNGENKPKKSLRNMLNRNRKIQQKNGIGRNEPVKHKEVGAR
ncbi:MAG: DUF3801 domain-containing protein [Firmicutes bacterium]|nr:DUF3801 domain-containing protein [Bacillota bacterium]